MGHVFVTQGDLTRLWCDAWLMPTGPRVFISPYWLREDVRAALGDRIEGAPYEQFTLREDVPKAYAEKRTRTFPFPGWPRLEKVPRPWLTNVGGNMSREPEWYVEGVEEFAREAATEGVRVTGRSKPLLGLPLVGTGAGGQWHRKALMTQTLLPTLHRLADDLDVDLVLVTYDDEAFAAAQVERRNLNWEWSDLDERHLRVGRRLAAHALTDDLVLFLGAGISMGAGLPSWQGLLEELGRRAQFDGEELEALRGLAATDQARVVERRLGGRAQLVEAIRECVSTDHYSISHTLVSRLPVETTVTLNYDQLFEQASSDQGHLVHVIPNRGRGRGERLLLKLHGCISRAEDIVLTREDYIRYGDRRSALAGFVQALLITHHMLFVGFGLADDNFHRILDDVRKVLGDPRDGAKPSSVGTVLSLVPEPLRDTLWDSELDIVPMSDDPDEKLEAARRLEILLDFVVYLTGQRPTYVMNESYESLLTADERAFRDELVGLSRQYWGRLSGTPVLDEFRAFLRRLGSNR